MSNAYITRRGSGVSLNFRVTRYNEGTDLSNIIGKHNEIAVLTNTRITDWTMAAEEPELPETGSLWILFGLSTINSINVLKKHTIRLNPMYVRQYETGTWKKKSAYIYRDGSWHDLAFSLYDEGDTCDILTGGWIATDAAPQSGTHTVPEVTFGASAMSISFINTGTVVTKDKVDLSLIKKLFLKGTFTNNRTNFYFGIGNVVGRADVKQVQIRPTLNEEGVWELDVAEYNDSYYVYMNVWGDGNPTFAVDVKRIWGE